MALAHLLSRVSNQCRARIAYLIGADTTFTGRRAGWFQQKQVQLALRARLDSRAHPPARCRFRRLVLDLTSQVPQGLRAAHLCRQHWRSAQDASREPWLLRLDQGL